MNDLIKRQEAIDALWKAMYEYEDEMEKQFIESDDLDIEEWIPHRIFVQNMSDIDRQTILKLPSADAVVVVRCKDCKHYKGAYCRYIYHMPIPHPRDFFCGWAERRTDDCT